MPFDPTIPPDGAFATGAALRGQFNALNDRLTALEASIAGTAQNPNVGTFTIALSDPPTRPEVQAILDFMNALVNSLTRV